MQNCKDSYNVASCEEIENISTIIITTEEELKDIINTTTTTVTSSSTITLNKEKYIKLLQKQVDDYDDMEDFKLDDQYLENLKKEYEATHKKKRQQSGLIKVGDMRISRLQKKDSEIFDAVKSAGLKTSDYNKALSEAKKTIKSIEEAAKKMKYEFTAPTDLTPEEAKEYLYKVNDIDSTYCNQYGLDTDTYIRRTTKYHDYSTKNQPEESLMIDIPHQLVYLQKLGEIFKSTFIQVTDVSINFMNIDFSICTYLKNLKLIGTHKLPRFILESLFKRLITAALSSMEQPMRSSSNWIKPEIKAMLMPDLIKFEALPGVLGKTYKVFVNELCNTQYLFNDLSKINYVYHNINLGPLAQTLARTIKCMSPCFMYDYYQVAKAGFLYAALIEAYIVMHEDDIIRSEDKEEFKVDSKKEDLDIIAKICFIVYQNIVHAQNSQVRLLPRSQFEISKEYQMYYLNHTLTGPQVYILKMLEKCSPYAF